MALELSVAVRGLLVRDLPREAGAPRGPVCALCPRLPSAFCVRRPLQAPARTVSYVETLATTPFDRGRPPRSPVARLSRFVSPARITLWLTCLGGPAPQRRTPGAGGWALPAVQWLLESNYFLVWLVGAALTEQISLGKPAHARPETCVRPARASSSLPSC